MKAWLFWKINVLKYLRRITELVKCTDKKICKGRLATNQYKTAYHDGEENEPFKITVFHKTAHTTAKLQPAKMLPGRAVTNHATLWKAVVYLNDVSFWTRILVVVSRAAR